MGSRPSLTGTREAACRMILPLFGLLVSPLRRRSNAPLVQVSPQCAHTPPKIRLIARSRNLTNRRLRKRMIPLATLGPVPDGRGHLGAPLASQKSPSISAVRRCLQGSPDASGTTYRSIKHSDRESTRLIKRRLASAVCRSP